MTATGDLFFTSERMSSRCSRAASMPFSSPFIYTAQAICPCLGLTSIVHVILVQSTASSACQRDYHYYYYYYYYYYYHYYLVTVRRCCFVLLPVSLLLVSLLALAS
ncbi:hypothetical protein GGI43DRAFT_391774, partial [Trichoderma evansii]